MSILSRIAYVSLGTLSALCFAAIAQETAPPAGDPPWQFSTSLNEIPKYQPGFPYFDYVNPNAPKGGRVRLPIQGGFDTFNPVLPLGEPVAGLGLVYETLMTSSMDEISSQYGLIAEAFRHPADYSSVTFRLNPNARWHDGVPITPEDVVWSFQKITALNPSQAFYYHNVVKAEKTGDREVTFTFDVTGNRELPHIMGQLMILPKHWWEAVGSNGRPRDISQPLYESPLGSGPYRIAGIIPGRTVTYARVPTAWAVNHPVNVGHHNFDQIAYEYYRDRTGMFEGFKTDEVDWWSENIARVWATEYTFPAVQDGRIVREFFANDARSSGIMTGFIFNLRKEIFQDPILREAITYAFDFEELNRTIFYEQYSRVSSFFFGTDLASTGLPQGLELEILNEVRGQVPARVFTQEYKLPVGGNPDSLEENLIKGLQLLLSGGYRISGTQLLRPNGQPVEFEIMLGGTSSVLEIVALHLQGNLAQMGIRAHVRIVDSIQYTNRRRNFEYDMIYDGWLQSVSPGNEQRDFWGTVAANQPASRNYAGIANPAIDQLIDRIIFAKDRETLEAATRALDRVLLANYYVLPSYTLFGSRIARWDRFARPATLPHYSIGFPTIWWAKP